MTTASPRTTAAGTAALVASIWVPLGLVLIGVVVGWGPGGERTAPA